MVISISATFTTDGVSNFEQALDNMPQIAKSALDQAVKAHEQEIKAVFEKEPTRAKTPVAFTSEEQRRFIWMNRRYDSTPNGNPYFYQPSDVMSSQFFVQTFLNNNGQVRLRMGNTLDWFVFIRGTFNKDKSKNYQQAYHKASGWTDIGDDIRPVIASIIETFRTTVGNEYVRAVRTRGYTPRTENIASELGYSFQGGE